MKTLKIILLIVIFLLLVLIPHISASRKDTNVTIVPVQAHVITPEEMSVEEMISSIVPRWNQDPKLISKISWCESQHKVKVHDGGYGLGVTGIHKKTFEKWLIEYEKENVETLDYGSTYDQLKMMTWAFSKGESYRDDWTTYVAYMKGGVYSFHSKLLNGDFTVYCK